MSMFPVSIRFDFAITLLPPFEKNRASSTRSMRELQARNVVNPRMTQNLPSGKKKENTPGHDQYQ
jgi:hypothetical protein